MMYALCSSRWHSRLPLTAVIRPAHSSRGFALLITVLLMSLLVLVGVSFAALTRVEIQIALNQQSQARARQHALLALDIAIGQLQKFAGPDARVSAQASLIGEAVANPWFTGIWSANQSSRVPLVWLVSGNEVSPLQVCPETALGRATPGSGVPLQLDALGVALNGPGSPAPNTVRLVGGATASAGGGGLADGGVVVPGVPINLTPPGFGAEKTVGRLAYWVGDQGVKASLGLSDRSGEVDYPPWFSSVVDDQRGRIRQQIATAPGYFRNVAAERCGFDPLAPGNDPLRSRLLELSQCQFLTPVAPDAPMGAFLRGHYHDFTVRAAAVLANTLPETDLRRGLLRDLSAQPALLGNAFAAHLNYPAYMELPSEANSAVPPITTTASPRRRYFLVPSVATAASAEAPALEFGVAPVLASFLIQFRVVRTVGGVQVRSRLFVELWNPYSAALVPPVGLTLEVTGLPTIQIRDPGIGGGIGSVDLQAVSAPLRGGGGSPAPMTVGLPFTLGPQTDRASWLPGRCYAWVTGSGPAPTANLTFYAKNMSAQGWSHSSGALAGTSSALQVSGGDHPVLTVRLKLGSDVLATYTSPTYPALLVANVEAPPTSGNWVFGYGFRLRQPSSLNKDRDWLTRAGADLRNLAPPASVFTAFNENLDLDPEAYVGTPATSAGVNNFLLYRAAGVALGSTRSANNDAPVFELPRLPPLSLGELQHLRFTAGRPFALGNSWGAAVTDQSGGTVNGWFDRFFFSGLPAAGSAPDLARGEPLPNGNLVPVDSRPVRAAPFSLEVVRDAGSAYTSRYLLQAGGFNVNACSPAAWCAVLSGLRFSTTRPFQRAVVDESATPNNYTGSQAGAGTLVAAETLADATLSDGASVGGPAFFRFPQSAQETYGWSNGATDGLLSMQTFRQGVRGGNAGAPAQQLTSAQLQLLAQQIVSLVRTQAAVDGPFRSLEAFLAPQAYFGAASLLEKAISGAGINPASLVAHPVPGLTDPGFGSLTLTPADLMTALAPYLRTRSDTFVVRAYGEGINPATSGVEGRAWCEATVQRFAETVAADDDRVAPRVGGFGRRFKILQFRWLSASDI